MHQCKLQVLSVEVIGVDANTAVLIGDGASDFCLATGVSAVFARNASGNGSVGLFEFCRRKNTTVADSAVLKSS